MSIWGIPIHITSRVTNPYDNEVSTKDTVNQMIALVRRAARYPVIHSVVNTLLSSLPVNYTNKDLARAIFWYVKGKVTFRQDEEIVSSDLGYQDWNQELLIDPGLLVSMAQPQGDCDDFSLLTATLLTAAHIPTKFVTIAADAGEPERFSHIYVKAWLDGKWVPMDTSHGNLLGWECENAYRRVEWNIICG